MHISCHASILAMHLPYSLYCSQHYSKEAFCTYSIEIMSYSHFLICILTHSISRTDSTMHMYPCMAISRYPTRGSSMSPAYSDSGLEDLMGSVESWNVSWQWQVTWIEGRFLNWIHSGPVMNHGVLQ